MRGVTVDESCYKAANEAILRAGYEHPSAIRGITRFEIVMQYILERPIVSELAWRDIDCSDIREKFNDQVVCLEFIKRIRWNGDTTICAGCGRDARQYLVTGRSCYACAVCGAYSFPLGDTIFRKTTTPLPKWFAAIQLIAEARMGVSARKIQCEIGVTYKTAWRLLANVKTALTKTDDPVAQ